MVMHARKPQRVNDGYFEKHQAHPYQSSKYSKRDYEREATSRSAFVRERDLSPGSGQLNNGNNNSYRTDSPDLDSPRDIKDRDRERERDRYQSSTYLQKMREKAERERDYNKKDKYNSECLRSPKDKIRDRRGGGTERDLEHRTNHDRSGGGGGGGGGGGSGGGDMNRRLTKLCSQVSSDKPRGGSSSNSDERDHRERDRDRDRNERDRDRDRGDRERVNRIGDWSEHVSSSGKKYYYNCQTEISQWEKPREWLEKERNLHREYREKERDREERFTSRSSYKHSNSRGNSRLRWTHESDMVAASSTSHRRRHENDSQDMDISPGDSTPTSEASYSHSSTPTTIQNNNEGPVLLATALPRLASHPSTPTNSQLQFTTPVSASLNSTSTCTTTSNQSNSGNNSNSLSGGGGGGGSTNLSQHHISKLNKPDNIHTTSLPASSPSGPPRELLGNLSGNSVQNENMLNPNTPGPPAVSLANLPKLLSQITGSKQSDHTEMNQQKAIQTINNAIMMSRQHSIGSESNHNSGSNSLREHTLNSPLYNLSHMHSMSMINHSGGSPYMSSGPGNNSLISDGPPTPTQDLDINDHRKLDGASASLSSLQGVSSQGNRSQGPSLTPSLANYFRGDLIAHVTGWPADMLEKQAQKCSDEAHLLGDLQCTRVSADLKIARSLVRITEITATLQEQKVMYLRQQIRRLEELKSQNSFMSDDL